MPSIARIRFTNLVYENGAKRYLDDIFRFDGHNGIILLENGGGKTVFVQAVLQAILPHTTLADRKAKDTFTLANSPAHLAVEWIINDKPRRYALTAVTLFSSKDGMDSYKYVYEYEPGDQHGLEGLPLVRSGEGGRMRPAGREEMLDYYQQMNRTHLAAHYFSSNREYQGYLEDNFKIIASEWRSVARINSAEGEIEGFFDGCRTTTQLVDQLLIPTVEEALAGKGTQDFVETFEKQREHFKKHRQLRERIEESQKVDGQISGYVAHYSSYEDAGQSLHKLKGETKSLHALAGDRLDQVLQGLEGNRLAHEQLQQDKNALERKEASWQLAGLEQELDQANQLYNYLREEHQAYQSDYDTKNTRWHNLDIARLRKRIAGSQAEIGYYSDQIQALDSDPDIKDLEHRIKNNAGGLRYCFLQEEGLLDKRRVELQSELDKIRQELRDIDAQSRKTQAEYQKWLVSKGQAETRVKQAEREMQRIAGQILANPLQDNVHREKMKWERRTAELERDRGQNQLLELQMQEEEQQLREELERLRPELQKILLEEASIKQVLDHIEKQQEGLLQSIKELNPELYALHSVYTQQSTIQSHLDGALENLHALKERAILQESQALALHSLYEPSTCYAADPVIEVWISEWREQFSYLELGPAYVAKAARQLAHSEKEYFGIYPFWAITLVCHSAEADRLITRLGRQAGRLTHPVFVLTQEEARAILDRRNTPGITSPVDLPALRRVFPSSWEINLVEGAFHDWKRELERNAREAGTERRQQEKKLQDMRLLAEQLRGFLEQYPYEENRRLQEAWREFHEQGQGIAQAIRKAEERQKELASLLKSLTRKIAAMQEEQLHFSNQIRQANDYIRNEGERDSARLELQQCLEKIPILAAEQERIQQQKTRAEEKSRELQNELVIVAEELRHLQGQTIYKEVAAVFPIAGDRGRSLLEAERQDLLDALNKKQKGRQHLEDILAQARRAKEQDEEQLAIKLRSCEVLVIEDMVFPPEGEREIDSLLQQIAELKQILKKLEPGLKQAEKNQAVARDRFDTRKKAFYEKYPEPVAFSKPLAVVREELQQEYDELRIRQDYLNRQESNLKTERDRFSEAQAELDKKNERYEYLSDKVIAVDLPSGVLQDFSYQTMGIVNQYILKLQEEHARVNQLREELHSRKRRLELFCQEEIKDIRLRRKVLNGLELRDNYQEVLGWQSRLSQRIALAIRHAEDDMREHDRELQQFINYLHNYLQTMAGELRIIPRKTRVKVEEDWKDIFLFEVPYWDEQEGKSELRRHVDWMISQIESDQYKDDSGNEDHARLHRDIEKWLRPQQLLRNVMKEKSIKVKCRKVTADGKVSSHPSPWESSNQWSGGEKWSKNMALFLGIQNYLAEKRQATNPGIKRNRSVILDNPFGQASSEHVLDPVFFIAEHLGFQIIALTALAEGSFVRDYFPIVYSCRLRPSTSADKYIMATQQDIRHAYFQDHEPEALRSLGEQKQLELF
ncbi:MAG: hypothetical protein GXY34_07100 [Syntrophomonadaceae bacterium]|nr:hypothetical protein [Syntrophomonadaceae bacterium]